MPTLKVPAIRFRQNDKTLYSFVADAKALQDYVTVDELHRDKNDQIVGFQRPEISAHIKEITAYFSGNPYAMLPNSIVLGFRKAPRFSPVGEKDSPVGELTLSEANQALIIDGQQRLAALKNAEFESEFPVNVVSFVAEDEKDMAEQFVRVNSSKPLQKTLLYELMPGLDAEFNKSLEKKRLPILLMNRLNNDEDSPLKGYIKTPTNDVGVIRDSTLIRMLSTSLSEGHLKHYIEQDNGLEDMVTVLKNYFGAAMDVFRKEFGTAPKQTKLLQAIGVVSLGTFMDRIANVETDVTKNTKARFVKALKVIKPHCAWSSGEWNMGPDGVRAWDTIENTAKSMTVLSNFLHNTYLKATRAAVRELVEETVELAPAG